MDSTEKTECPMCGGLVPRRGGLRPKSYPFCSDRCQLLDLGRWLDESYRIPDDASNGQ
jgi:endogenous inhibitor of DNA gyrase (YacG/DUF329 family)